MLTVLGRGRKWGSLGRDGEGRTWHSSNRRPESTVCSVGCVNTTATPIPRHARSSGRHNVRDECLTACSLWAQHPKASMLPLWHNKTWWWKQKLGQSDLVYWVYSSSSVYTLCPKKSDAKIQITITMAYLTRIEYPLSGFDYHPSDVNIANFNNIYRTVSEHQLF